MYQTEINIRQQLDRIQDVATEIGNHQNITQAKNALLRCGELCIQVRGEFIIIEK